jgi:hypothetical protein
VTVADAIVFVVDDDAGTRGSLENLIRWVGLDQGFHIVGRLPEPQTLQAVVVAVRAGLAMRPRT